MVMRTKYYISILSFLILLNQESRRMKTVWLLSVGCFPKLKQAGLLLVSISAIVSCLLLCGSAKALCPIRSTRRTQYCSECVLLSLHIARQRPLTIGHRACSSSQDCFSVLRHAWDTPNHNTRKNDASLSFIVSHYFYLFVFPLMGS